ncbi:MAG TPA: hypothetical protein PLH75_11010 [Amaricoccus sp.]|uniref:hypothetical protein n=1 Tax=Amaricoccus sp. TaxID=1872485 RepID=UPI001E10D813|nr:hypothetical protein [Amaricoccus sp.]MCB1374566.1 hypothetical protein [Paracoccaceae bacterium]MCC0066652.1 hypothetical protein [Rhodovulum sp.]HPG23304.1 hypothetical protein [Amaricoccus sp.]HRW15568.1 hypothetical protein [Amaricoccus sp.]
MIRNGTGFLAALALAGCASTAAPPGLPTVSASPTPGATAPVARGETQLIVRAVPAGGVGELQGASCEAVSPYFSARFTAPARLLMPSFGAESPQVTVTCAAGAASGSVVAAPTQAWSNGLGGWPAVGVSVGTGNAGGVGVGFGWYGGGYGASGGVPVVRYGEVRVPVPVAGG